MIAKKTAYVAIVIVVIMITSSCMPPNTVESTMPQTFDSTAENYPVVIAQDPHFLITRESEFDYSYQIIDLTGEVVRHRSLKGREPSISTFENGVLDIAVGYGTGVILHTYYDVRQNRFSEEYYDVTACDGKKLAYLFMPSGGSMDDRRLVVQDIFEKEVFYQEYQLDFAQVVQPILDAAFTAEGDALHLVYMDGTGENVMTLDLNMTGDSLRTGDGSVS